MKYLAILILLFSVSVQAATKADLQKFVSQAAELDLPTRFLEEGLRSVRSVQFVTLNGGATALYYPGLNQISLSNTLLDGQGRLKDLSVLSPVDAGVIYHEFWHAYFHNVLRRTGGSLLEFFRQGFSAYSMYPSSKREEIQDESYGVAIQGMIGSYLQLRAQYRSRTPEQKEKFRESVALKRIWESVPTNPYYGYYQSGGLFGGGLVNSQVRLPQPHVQRVLDELLDRKFPALFEDEFH